MDLHFIDLHACPPQPWRNGGGRTRELLAWPRASDWRLRVSVARIEHSGPFSAFPGIWRGFTVLQGEGVTLDLPGGARTLTPADDPTTFDGEAAPMCHLLDGPTEDLNLMARRDAGCARLRRARPGDAIEGTTRWRGVTGTRSDWPANSTVTEASSTAVQVTARKFIRGLPIKPATNRLRGL